MTASKAPQEPGEFVVVPRRPTDEMIDRGHEFCRRNHNMSMDSANKCYRAMLSASPYAGTMVAVPRELLTRIEAFIVSHARPGPVDPIVLGELRTILRGGAAAEGAPDGH